MKNAGIGINVSEKKKDAINKDLANKEIRVLDLHVTLNIAAQLKKEREENNREEGSDDNEYCKFS